MNIFNNKYSTHFIIETITNNILYLPVIIKHFMYLALYIEY